MTGLERTPKVVPQCKDPQRRKGKCRLYHVSCVRVCRWLRTLKDTFYISQWARERILPKYEIGKCFFKNKFADRKKHLCSCRCAHALAVTLLVWKMKLLGKFSWSPTNTREPENDEICFFLLEDIYSMVSALSDFAIRVFLEQDHQSSRALLES